MNPVKVLLSTCLDGLDKGRGRGPVFLPTNRWLRNSFSDTPPRSSCAHLALANLRRISSKGRPAFFRHLRFTKKGDRILASFLPTSGPGWKRTCELPGWLITATALSGHLASERMHGSLDENIR